MVFEINLNNLISRVKKTFTQTLQSKSEQPQNIKPPSTDRFDPTKLDPKDIIKLQELLNDLTQTDKECLDKLKNLESSISEKASSVTVGKLKEQIVDKLIDIVTQGKDHDDDDALKARQFLLGGYKPSKLSTDQLQKLGDHLSEDDSFRNTSRLLQSMAEVLTETQKKDLFNRLVKKEVSLDGNANNPLPQTYSNFCFSAFPVLAQLTKNAPEDLQRAIIIRLNSRISHNDPDVVKQAISNLLKIADNLKKGTAADELAKSLIGAFNHNNDLLLNNNRSFTAIQTLLSKTTDPDLRKNLENIRIRLQAKQEFPEKVI